MKLGFSSNAFSDHSLLYSIDVLSKIGYDGIEIVLDVPHAFLPLKKNDIYEIKKSLFKNNLQVTNLNSNTVLGWHNNFSGEKFEPSLSNSNKKLRDWRISYTKQAIDLAEDLDSKSISITSGLENGNDSETCFNLFQNSLSKLSEYAEKKNVIIAIEYEPYLLINTYQQVWQITQDFKNIGLNLDTCHAEVNKESLSEIISVFKKKIFHTHVSDCKNHIHYHLIPGEGTINFQQMIESLNKVNYSGYLTSELYTYSKTPEKAASKAFIYLENLIK